MSSIREYVAAEPLFDNHEHQGGFAALEGRKGELAFREFVGYANADVATSMGPDCKAPGNLSDEEFFHWWSFVRTTGYGQATELTCRSLLGLDYTQANADAIRDALAEFVRDRNGEQIYDDMLGRANIVGAVNDACWNSPTELDFFTGREHPSYYGHALRYDNLLVLSARSDMERLERALDLSIHRLADLDAALDAYTERAREAGKLVAMKCGLAYRRPLSFEGSSFAEAETAFEAVMQERPADLRPLHDYLFHRFVQRAAEFGLPVQVHTGYLAGNWGMLGQTNPELLIPILRRYKNVRFDLFHAGWPYSEVAGAIGKEFPNVWLDLCWAWTMNPAQMERILSEWLAAVPHNKVFAFGGDTGSPFPMLGYALQARDGIANVLAEAVERGRYDEATAQQVARRIMHANAREFYRVD